MAVAFVQAASLATATNSASKAFTSSNTAGNCIVVYGGFWHNISAPPTGTISDTAGNVYTLVSFTSRAFSSTSTSSAYLWVAPNCIGGANTVTVTGTTAASTLTGLQMGEYSGVDTVSPVTAHDTNAFGVLAAGTKLAAGISPVYKDNALLFFGFDQTNPTETWTGSCTQGVTLTNRGNTNTLVASQYYESIFSGSLLAYVGSISLSLPTNALHIAMLFLSAKTTALGNNITPVDSSLPAGLVGISYSQTLSSGGGTSPYTYSIVSGSLPSGLSLSAGVISGTPTTVGTSTFSINSTDANGFSGSFSFSITISNVSSGGSFVFIG